MRKGCRERETRSGGKGEAGEEKQIWWVTTKKKNEGKTREGREGSGVYGMSSSSLSVGCLMCWGGSC